MAATDTGAAASAPLRWGLRLIGIAGIVLLAVWLYWLTGPTDIDKDTKRYVDWTIGAGFASGLVYLLGLAALILGLVALYALLARGAERGLALGGLVLGVVGTSLLLAMFGTLTMGSVAVAIAYRDGNTGVVPAMHNLSGGEFPAVLNFVFFAAALLCLLSAVAYGMAIWRAGAFPKWTAIVFGLGFVLIAASIPFTAYPGGILLAVAGFGLAHAFDHQPAGRLARTAEGSMA
ncbi:MAG TPA: hypothetical protein VFI42_09430 [Thermomicrobiaceae bacterium]|nr:hypothetical protein [Thermomicrobiaceae bacterium]